MIARRPLLILLGTLLAQAGTVTETGATQVTPPTQVSPPSSVPQVWTKTVALDSRTADPVRTVRSDVPFSLVGLRWTAVTAPDVTQVRIQRGRDWGPWIDVDPADVPLGAAAGDARTGPGSAGGRSGPGRVGGAGDGAGGLGGGASEPVWTGESTQAQVRALRGGVPAHDVSLVLVNPGHWTGHEAPPASRAGGYQVISRAAWGADESLRCQAPQYDDSVRALTLHHTAGTNDYTREQSAGIVRAIYTYHARTLGWCDIGYHALVDRYGQIFEGHAGGLTRPVIGAHSGGFNRRTSSVAMIGMFTESPPPDAQFWALAAYLNWKLDLHRLDPKGQTKLVSQGGGTSRYAKGAEVTVPVLFGHRDVGATACPGDAGYALLPRLRDIADRAPVPD